MTRLPKDDRPVVQRHRIKLSPRGTIVAREVDCMRFELYDTLGELGGKDVADAARGGFGCLVGDERDAEKKGTVGFMVVKSAAQHNLSFFPEPKRLWELEMA